MFVVVGGLVGGSLAQYVDMECFMGELEVTQLSSLTPTQPQSSFNCPLHFPG